MKRVLTLMFAVMSLSLMVAAQGNSNGHGHGKGNQSRDDYDQGSGPYIFSSSDRIRISDCLTGNGGQGLPPGLAKRDHLPPGLEKQLRRNGHLPPGLEKKMQPMPRSCEVRLPRWPSNVTRVIVGNYVILRDIHGLILDIFDYYRR
jgi:hypothetical protein